MAAGILITGKTGFVGQHVCRHLLKLGRNVIDTSSRGRLDVTDLGQLMNIEDIDAIIHLAAKTFATAIEDPHNTYHTNILGTLNVLELARSRKVKKFIYVSTYVYGKAKYLPIDESHPANPHTPYSASKYIAEQLCKNYSDFFGLDIAVMRPFYFYGPGIKPDSFVPSIIRQIRGDGRVSLSGEKTTRDFLFVDDFADLLVRVLDNFPSGYNIYNVGFGASHTLKEVAEIIAELMNKKIMISYDHDRPGDIIDQVANISKVSNAFDWKPLTDLHDGLRLTLQSGA